MNIKKLLMGLLFSLAISSLGLFISACDNNSSENSKNNHYHFGTTILEENKILPTCHSSGSYESVVYCDICGVELSRKNVTLDALQHTFSNYTYDNNATCTKNGTETAYCANGCGFWDTREKTNSILSHNFLNYIYDNNATCTKNGTETAYCSSGCNTKNVREKQNSKLEHQYNNGQIISNATCISQGIKKYTCTNTGCGYSYTESYSMPTYSAIDLYNLAVKYVGEITIYNKSGTQLALGTGFVISSDGKIITNYHVVEGAYSAKIAINNKTYTIEKILAYDEKIDLAILKINATGLEYANICKNPIQTGATVYAIGSSRGLTNTYSQGIVTQANRVVDGIVHIQHDASITNGNSGGPLLNVYGEVIGINTWGILDSQNLNFAVFTSELDNLIYGTPLTLSELYELNNSAFDKLVDYILSYGQYDSNGNIELRLTDGYNDSGTQYQITAFTYEPKNNIISLTHWAASVNSDITLFTGISLEKDSDSYYYATYIRDNGVLMNRIAGYIDAKTFNSNTLLGYIEYEGATSQIYSLREDSSAICDYLISYLEWFVINYLDLTIADFGFTSF